MDPVVHFELPAEDRERMAAFYAAAFGWQTEPLGPDMGNYTVVSTTESDGSRPTTPGAINGGFFLKTSDPALARSISGNRGGGCQCGTQSRRAGRWDDRGPAAGDSGRGSVRQLSRL